MVPRYSVIIPTLNEEKFLPKLLESLAAQTDRNFEVMVVDGSSKDKTITEAESFTNVLPKLKVIVSPQASLPLQRNLGAKAAHGDWLIFIDADSVLMPYFMKRIGVYIDQKNPKAFTTWVQPDSDEVNDSIFTLLANIVLEGSLLVKRPLAPGPLTAIRSDIFRSVGGYNESHAFNEDVELGLRLSKKHIVFKLIREALYIWSMRRIRREGKMKYVNQMILSALPILIIKRPFKYMPGYVMGGQLYTNKKKKKFTAKTLKGYEKNLKKLLKEIFE